jgi:hypothetical protein
MMQSRNTRRSSDLRSGVFVLGAILMAAGAACTQGIDDSESSVGQYQPAATYASFGWNQAGALVYATQPLQVTTTEAYNDHFSWIAQYAMVGCNNSNQPFSCANNGCIYPGAPDGTWIPSYATLASWLGSQSPLHAGVWMASAAASQQWTDDGGARAAAEGHCMAEVLNTLKSQYGVAPKFVIIDAEGAYQTNRWYANAFLTGYPLSNKTPTGAGPGNGFKGTLSYGVPLGLTPECRGNQWYSVWRNAGGIGAILPQAYWNDGAGDPAYCINTMSSTAGISDPVPASMIHPMLDAYKGWSPHDQKAYANDLRSVAGMGFSLWEAGAANNDVTHWRNWKALLETEPQIATYGSCERMDGGDSLSPGGMLKSCNGQAMLSCQSDGNLVVYDQLGPRWATGTNSSSPGQCRMQTDGNFVVYNSAGAALWGSGTQAYPGAYLRMQDDCNLVIYDSSGTPRWASNTSCRCGSMHGGQALGAGGFLKSCNGQATLACQSDGSLVVYDRLGYRWSSGSSTSSPGKCVMQSDGNLVIYNSSGTAIWGSGTQAYPGASLRMQDDCNLVVYDQNNVARWSSGTQSCR